MDDSNDTKIGIMLGFILVVLAQITISKGFIDLVFSEFLSQITFCLGFLILLYGGYCGLSAYDVKKYSLGPDLTGLIEQFKEGKVRDYSKAISKETYNALTRNARTTQKKVGYMKTMFEAFFIGLILIILSRVLVGIIR